MARSQAERVRQGRPAKRGRPGLLFAHWRVWRCHRSVERPRASERTGHLGHRVAFPLRGERDSTPPIGCSLADPRGSAALKAIGWCAASTDGSCGESLAAHVPDRVTDVAVLHDERRRRCSRRRASQCSDDKDIRHRQQDAKPMATTVARRNAGLPTMPCFDASMVHSAQHSVLPSWSVVFLN
jgi:hypothetical protein